MTKGLVRSNKRVLSLLTNAGSYELNDQLELRPVKVNESLFAGVAQPKNSITVDEASAVIKEDGKTYRIPKNVAYKGDLGRICREVATERDLFNFHGTFYELPARNAAGFAKIRPIATHNLAIDDYASHFGLLFITGLNDKVNDRVIRSDDGKAALWAGVIDDLWRLGKPRGKGGPWKNSPVEAGVPSDPYLMTGYDKKSVRLEADREVRLTLEIDINGTGVWVPYKTLALSADKPANHRFPEGFSAYWVRAVSDTACRATAMFTYD